MLTVTISNLMLITLCRATVPSRHSVHSRLLQILQNPGCRFLEIGVGPTFRQERFRAIDDLGIHYVGLDFEHVCGHLLVPTSIFDWRRAQ